MLYPVKSFFNFRFFIILTLFFSAVLSHAQEYRVSGRVNDSASAEPLAFVNIVINEGRQGGVTDIDGRYSLVSHEPVRSLRFSYVGYRPLLLSPVNEKAQVKMVSLGFELSEVLIAAGENPAHRIIRNAVANRKINDPENIPYYTYTSYDKMYFTADADSLRRDEGLPADSSEIRLLKILERQHLFLIESLAEHQYIAPGRSKDRVIATRISGLKDPLFVFLISSMQSNSFYGDLINIAGANYINPVSRGSEQRYFFSLQDTIYSDTPGDTTFVIAYKPRANRNFDGLKGLVYISNNSWAIRNVIAEPARPDEKLGIRIRQMYEFLNGRYWFPVQLETEITFNNLAMSRSRPVGIGKSYRRDIVFDTVLSRREVGNIAVELTPDAADRDEAFWFFHRGDSLSLKERNTYQTIDSLGRVHRLDQKAKGFAALISGRLPLGYAEIDLNRLARYSKYEGLYAGIGLYTSNRLSRVVKVGGYWGYGFGDQQAKYGGELSFRLQRHGNAILNLSYADDLEESAGTVFFDDNNQSLNALNYRRFYIDRMELTEKYRAMLDFRVLRYIRMGAGVVREYKRPGFDYAFDRGSDDIGVLTRDHIFGKITAGLRFAWGEKFIRDKDSQLSLGTTYPILWLQYTASRKGFLDGQFDYNRLDLRLKWTFYTRFIGNTVVWLAGSYIDKTVPGSELVNGRGSSGNGFSLFSPVSFSTMRPGEFLNDRFGAVFITHNFGKLLFRSAHFEPEPALIFNAGIGSLSHPEKHRFAQFNTMEKGYAEAGFALNNIIKSSFSGIGVALLYRGGAYSYDRFGKNIMGRLTLNYSF